MKIAQMIGKAILVLASVASLGRFAFADVYLPKDLAKQVVPTSVESAEDIVASLPVISKIPKSFIIGDGFRFKLSAQELRIDHMGSRSKAPAHKRVCMVGLSYTTPVAFFGSRIELPLFHAATPKLSDWGMNTLGDYVLYFSKDAAVENPVLGLQISARF